MIRRLSATGGAGAAAARILAAVVLPLLLVTACSSERLVPDAVPAGAHPGGQGDGPEESEESEPGAPEGPASYDAALLRTPQGRMIGVASEGGPGDPAPVDAFAAKTGRKPDLREYYLLWGAAFDPAGNAALWAAGQVPLISWVPGETPLAAIADGDQDDYLAEFADRVASYGGPLAIALAPEMNSAWNPWGPGRATAADFVRAWRHVHGLFADHGVSNVLWVWSPHVSDQHSSVGSRPYYPGDAYTDWVGMVGYYGPEDGSAYGSLFAPMARELRGFTRKPLVISETGVAEGPHKARQIADLFKGAAATEGLVGLVWFDLRKDWPGSAYRTDWRVDSSAAAAAAAVAAIGAHRFGHPAPRG
ncbi:glycoside hydrolase family 26 protein [Kitasatospora sp. NBC_01539]|uniref:glycoside hydrolase family 26 protein n=1 Tax=Kitasatospora sp. NBC_01539 TaxID=2903577 RepID=UPI0038600F7F